MKVNIVKLPDLLLMFSYICVDPLGDHRCWGEIWIFFHHRFSLCQEVPVLHRPLRPTDGSRQEGRRQDDDLSNSLLINSTFIFLNEH